MPQLGAGLLDAKHPADAGGGTARDGLIQHEAEALGARIADIDEITPPLGEVATAVRRAVTLV